MAAMRPQPNGMMQQYGEGVRAANVCSGKDCRSRSIYFSSVNLCVCRRCGREWTPDKPPRVAQTIDGPRIIHGPPQTDELLLAWAAGHLDADGSLTLNNGAGRPYLTLQMRTPYKDALLEFKRIMGCGKIHGPYSDKRGVCKEYWDYRATGPALRRIMALLVPLMRTAKRLRFIDTLRRGA